MLQNVYISLPYIMAARTAGIDGKELITSLLTVNRLLVGGGRGHTAGLVA